MGKYLDEWLRDAVDLPVSRRTHEKRAWAVNVHIKPALRQPSAFSLGQRLPAPLDRIR